MELLQKDYEERCEVFEKVKALLADALKNFAKLEKDQVGYEERRKHAKTKQKKLKKSINDVRVWVT